MGSTGLAVGLATDSGRRKTYHAEPFIFEADGRMSHHMRCAAKGASHCGGAGKMGGICIAA